MIRRIDIASARVTTLAGVLNADSYADGFGTSAKFNTPWGIAIYAGGAYAIVVDRLNNCVRRIDLSSVAVTTLAGNPVSRGFKDGFGTNAQFDSPGGVAIDPTGSYALVVSAGEVIPVSLE